MSCHARSQEDNYRYVLYVLPWNLMRQDKIEVICPTCQATGAMDPSQSYFRCKYCGVGADLDFPVLEPDERVLLSNVGEDDGQETALGSGDAGRAPSGAANPETPRASRTSGDSPRSSQ